MADFKAERKLLEIEIGEHKFSVKKASLGQIEAMTEKMAAVGEGEKAKAIPIMKQFLLDLGVPQAAIDDLDVEGFHGLCELLSGSKKN